MFSIRTKGILCGILAAITYGLNPLFAVPLYGEGFSPDAVLFYRYSGAALLFLILIPLRKVSFKLEKNQIIPAVVAGVMMALSSLTLFESYTLMDVGVAATILFIYPVMVAVIMAAFFHEKISWITILCILTSFAGVASLSKSGNGAFISLKGIIYVVISALTFAIYLVMIKVTTLRSLPAEKMTFFCLIFGIPLFFCRLGFGTAIPAVPPHALAWTCLVLIVLLPTMLSFSMTALAIRFAGPTLTAILGALEPFSSVLVGIIAFHEAFTHRLLFGLLLIVSSVVVIALEKPILEGIRRLRSGI